VAWVAFGVEEGVWQDAGEDKRESGELHTSRIELHSIPSLLSLCDVREATPLLQRWPGGWRRRLSNTMGGVGRSSPREK
jgi:hypothetical protein